MAEAGALLALLVLAAGAAALRAVLDGRRTGTPASIAVLAPLAEAARLVRTRGTRPGARTVVAGVLLLASPVLRVLALPFDGRPLADALLPALVADLAWWAGVLLLAERRPPAARLRGAVALELPVVAALLVTVFALPGSTLPLVVEAPVAFLVLLVVEGVLLPWSVAGPADRLGGIALLLVRAAVAAQLVAGAATASAVFLDGGRTAVLVGAALLACALLVLERRVPLLGLARRTRLAVAVLLPLAVAQLALVIVLRVLGG